MIIESVIAEQQKWHGLSMQGCIFAGHLFKNLPESSKIHSKCFLENISQELIENIELLITDLIKDENAFLVSIILPAVKTKADLLTLIDLCKKNTDWTIEDEEIWENKRLIKIRVSLGENDESGSEIFSWMLGFGNFSFFPPTRQSPYFEIMLPLKSKYFFKKTFNKFSLNQHFEESIDRGTATKDAHLADVFIEKVTDNLKRDELLWNQSKSRKKKLLTTENKEYNDTNAKAKITFSYPIT